MRKILIAVPCMDTVPAPFAHSLATLTSFGIEDTQLQIRFNIGSLVYTSRNQLAKVAIEEGFDYVMWFDSDMVFNPDAMRILLKHLEEDNMDMVTGIYFRRTPPFTPTVFKTMDVNEAAQESIWTEFDVIPNEPFEVEACGFGCVLMKTEILVAVFNKFGNMFSPIGNTGEDIALCWRARQCGYKIFADPSVSLGHVGHTVITKEFFQNYQLAHMNKAERGE